MKEKMLGIARENLIGTIYDRSDQQSPQCGFGELALCCRSCSMGACRIDPFEEVPGEGPKRGICGSNGDLMAAKDLLRSIAVGLSAHVSQAAFTTKVVEGAVKEGFPYEIKEESKLDGITTDRIFEDLYGSEDPYFLKYMPDERIKRWESLGILPVGISREILDAEHRLHIGVDSDPESMMVHALRLGICDGMSMIITTMLQDALFRSPGIEIGEVGFGTLKEDEVNIAVLGQMPIVGEKIFEATRDSGLRDLARENGAKGIEVYGLGCVGNELFVRHGIPLLGGFPEQGLVTLTGAMDAIVCDNQCIMPGLAQSTMNYHTKVITTLPHAKIPGTMHMELKWEEADDAAKEIVKIAIENYKNRNPALIRIPEEKSSIKGGFSEDSIPIDAISDGLKEKKIKGIACIWGCSNPKIDYDHLHVEITKRLIQNDVLVFGVGCWAYSVGGAGILADEVEICGRGLSSFCKEAKIPPVIHLGSYVDLSRFFRLIFRISDELGIDLNKLPIATSSPAWMSDKSLATSMFFVSLGLLTVLGTPICAMNNATIKDILTKEFEGMTGGKICVEKDPERISELIIEHLEERSI